MRDVADDRPAERHTVLLLLRSSLDPRTLLEDAAGSPVGRRAVPEETAAEIVAARPGDRNDGGAAQLVELGLVVLGDHLVFADRGLRERIAATGVLARDAARRHVVLL